MRYVLWFAVLAGLPFILHAAEAGDMDGGNRALVHTVKQGGPLMVVLLFLALVSLTIIIERVIYFSRNGAWLPKRINTILDKSVEGNKTAYREELENTLQTDLSVYVSSLERGLPLLSGIGNLSPIVGFLGTVIGMISAFGSIAAATTVNAKVVAVGIQIALVTTAGGLIVAAPALCAYYFFSHVVQCRITEAEERITDVTLDRTSVLALITDDETSNPVNE